MSWLSRLRLQVGGRRRADLAVDGRDESAAEAAWQSSAWSDAVVRWQVVLEAWEGKAPPRVFARLGGAQRRAGDAEGAERTLLAGLDRHPGNERLERMLAELSFRRGDWGAAAEQWGAIVRRDPAASTHAVTRLSSALRQLGRLDDADAALRAALETHPDDYRLRYEHAQLATASGDRSTAVERWERTVATSSPAPAAAWVRYCRALRAGADLDRAAEAVDVALGIYPTEAALLRERAETAAARWDWPAAVDAWRAVRASEASSPNVAHRLAYALERDGRASDAAEIYEEAIDGLRSIDEPWVNEAEVAWRFRHRYAARRAGSTSAADVRLDCVVAPVGSVAGAGGRVGAMVTHKGLRLDGQVKGDMKHVDVLIDERLVRRVTVDGDGVAGAFALHLKHPTLATFRPRSVIDVAAPDGSRLATGAGTDRFEVTVPHGDGSLSSRLDAGASVTKKGTLFDPRAFARNGAREQMEVYGSVRRVLAQGLGQPLVLLYGTLLGYHRDGAFIPGDDDLDVGYLSSATDAASLRTEAIRASLLLLRAGFDVTTRFGGGLLKVIAGEVELDVYPLWSYDGSLWGYDELPVGPEAILPAHVDTFHGAEVDVPNDPEALLLASYGPGWRVPDPDFRHVRPQRVTKIVASSYLTAGEARDLTEVNVRDRRRDPTVGTFEVTRDPYRDLEEFRPR